jgi:hypothetical protein
LKEASSTEIAIGLNQSILEAPELHAFDPTIDGPGGLFPEIASKLINTGHFARIPFIAGTNLDEGLFIMSVQRNIFLNSPLCFRNYIHLQKRADNGRSSSQHCCKLLSSAS